MFGWFSRNRSWQPIATAPENTPVDVWVTIFATPRTMGYTDSFRVPDAYKRVGRWYYIVNNAEKELDAQYVTHWMWPPESPYK